MSRRVKVRRFPAADLVALFPPIPDRDAVIQNRRHNLGPLVGSHEWVAAKAGVSVSAVQRWRDGTRPWLKEPIADLVATNWGMHPSQIWEGWFDDLELLLTCDCRPPDNCPGCDCTPETLEIS